MKAYLTDELQKLPTLVPDDALGIQGAFEFELEAYDDLALVEDSENRWLQRHTSGITMQIELYPEHDVFSLDCAMGIVLSKEEAIPAVRAYASYVSGWVLDWGRVVAVNSEGEESWSVGSELHFVALFGAEDSSSDHLILDDIDVLEQQAAKFVKGAIPTLRDLASGTVSLNRATTASGLVASIFSDD